MFLSTNNLQFSKTKLHTQCTLHSAWGPQLIPIGRQNYRDDLKLYGVRNANYNSRIRATKHLLTDADSRTDKEGGPRIPENPIFLKNRKNHQKRKKLKNV